MVFYRDVSTFRKCSKFNWITLGSIHITQPFNLALILQFIGEIVMLEQVPAIAGAIARDKQGTYDIYLQIVN